MDLNLENLFTKNSRILVTGGAGFIGGCLIRRLLSETDSLIFNLDKLSYEFNLKLFNSLDQKYLKRYKFFKVNLCDYDNLSKIVFLSKPDGISSIISKVTVFVLCLFGYFKKLFFGQNKPAL